MLVSRIRPIYNSYDMVWQSKKQNNFRDETMASDKVQFPVRLFQSARDFNQDASHFLDFNSRCEVNLELNQASGTNIASPPSLTDFVKLLEHLNGIFDGRKCNRKSEFIVSVQSELLLLLRTNIQEYV